jgi:hypothetical protein
MGPMDLALSAEEEAQLARGVDQFNTGYFFECHDTLEDLWSGISGTARDFLQGLIQVAVAFYHLGNGNRTGAQSLLARALRRFEAYPDVYGGFDLAAHRTEIASWRDRVAEAELGELTLADLPKWRFDA